MQGEFFNGPFVVSARHKFVDSMGARFVGRMRFSVINTFRLVQLPTKNIGGNKSGSWFFFVNRCIFI